MFRDLLQPGTHELKKVWVELGADRNAGGTGIRVLGGGRQGERGRVGGCTGEMTARCHMGADGLGGLAGLKVTWSQ